MTHWIRVRSQLGRMDKKEQSPMDYQQQYPNHGYSHQKVNSDTGEGTSWQPGWWTTKQALTGEAS